LLRNSEGMPGKHGFGAVGELFHQSFAHRMGEGGRAG